MSEQSERQDALPQSDPDLGLSALALATGREVLVRYSGRNLVPGSMLGHTGPSASMHTALQGYRCPAFYLLMYPWV